MATWMAHPDGPGPALVADTVFAEVWGPRGWEAVDIDLAAASILAGQPVTDPAMLDVETVRQLLAERRTAAEPVTPAQKKTKTTTAATPATTNSEG